MADLPFFKPTINSGGGSYEGVVDFRIDNNGDLLVTFANGTSKNLGRVVGENGAVYVPYIDEHNVLSFTLEERPQRLPDPVDLNPNDEWSGIDGEPIETDYVWEGIS